MKIVFDVNEMQAEALQLVYALLTKADRPEELADLAVFRDMPEILAYLIDHITMALQINDFPKTWNIDDADFLVGIAGARAAFHSESKV